MIKECGESVTSVGRHFHSNEFSVRTVEQTQAASRFSVEAGMMKSAEVAYKIHEPLAEKAKKTLLYGFRFGTKKMFLYMYNRYK